MQQLINLILYSNLWIGLAAVVMALQTSWLLSKELKLDALAGFVFCATLFVYAIHRIVGLEKVAKFKDKGRYLIISTFRSHILIYAVAAAIGTGLFFLQLSLYVQMAVVIPALLSLGYVLPILTQKRRVRDLHFIKIFMIALVWSAVTVGLPFLSSGDLYSNAITWLFTERMLFIFAITIPFDIRDLQIDQHTQVKTIPNTIGIQKSKWLAIFALFLSLCCALLNTVNHFYTTETFLRLTISLLIAAILVYYSDKVTHDYYFTGLLDGMMILQFLLVVML